MWGIVPAAGQASRLQPLAFSKELLPVGRSFTGERERPRAVGEYLLDRMRMAGASRICIVIAPEKSDIVAYFGDETGGAKLCYVVQPRALGLCDAIFRALPFIPEDETVLVGLPDTVWFPEDGLGYLVPCEDLNFLCFPVTQPEHFDAVVSNDAGIVEMVQVKDKGARSPWIWGAFAATAKVLRSLHELWCERGASEHFFGTLVNAWIERGGRAKAVRAGTHYIDVGTVRGFQEAVRVLGDR